MRTKASPIFLLFSLAIAAGLLSSSASAESVNVPFEFVAHDHNFPGGTYAIEPNQARHMVTLHSLKGDATINWMMGGSEWNGGHVLLSFSTATNGMHVLKSIQFGRRFTIEDNAFQSGLPKRMPLQP